MLIANSSRLCSPNVRHDATRHGLDRFRTSLLEQLDPSIERLVKRLFLAPQRFLDVLLLRADFGKDIAHRSGEDIDELEEERLVKSERASVADGAAQDAAQDVAAAFVARLNAVGDREAQRADVIGDDAEGDVDLFLLVWRRL